MKNQTDQTAQPNADLAAQSAQISAVSPDISPTEECAAASAVQSETPSAAQQKERGKVTAAAFKQYFTATRISFIAVFTALSFILRLPWFEFYIIPAVSFLKVDFSGVFVMISGFALGPVAGMIVSVLKEILYGIAFSQTVGVGELANILIMLPYILIPTILYKRHKGIKAVLITIAAGCVCQVVWSVPVNYLLTFPFYLNLYAHFSWRAGMEFYLSVWYWAFLFNLVKTVLISAVTLVVYKPLSMLIKKTNARFAAVKDKRRAKKEG